MQYKYSKKKIVSKCDYQNKYNSSANTVLQFI